MKKGLSGRLALDTSVLIELMFASPAGLKLKEALKDAVIEAYTTELNIAELKYILCRKIGLTESTERVNKLLASGYVSIEDTMPLVDAASKYKCERTISLADCFCLALAHKTSCNTLFARREKELIKEMKKKTFNVKILFLEDYT